MWFHIKCPFTYVTIDNVHIISTILVVNIIAFSAKYYISTHVFT